MTRLNPIVILCTSMHLIIAAQTFAQDNANLSGKATLISNQLLKNIDKKASRIAAQVVNTNERALKQLLKQESRLQKKLYKKDSLFAKQLFDHAYTQYQTLQSDATNKVIKIAGRAEYIPLLDTITTSIHFLEKNSTLVNNPMIQQSLKQISRMQQRFQQSRSIQQYLCARQQYLREQLSKLNMEDELKKYNKELYYYQAQLSAYKDLVNQPDKIARKAIDLLTKTKPFQDFIARNSILAALFRNRDNLSIQPSQTGISGLQTSAQVNSLIQRTTAGPNNLQALQSGMQQAQSQIQQLKNKVNEKGGSSDEGLPNFRPNQQRVKSFWNRWELGTNLQSTRSNAWLPSATQLGISAGYKLNDRSIIGLGMAGSIGWGKSIEHIIVSYEGAGARSFLDYKLKGSLWLTSGYELNYRQSIASIDGTSPPAGGGGWVGAGWQQSGLLGISKKYQVNKKLKGNLSLLWDYLSYTQIPRTQPIVFRFGYSFK